MKNHYDLSKAKGAKKRKELKVQKSFRLDPEVLLWLEEQGEKHRYWSLKQFPKRLVKCPNIVSLACARYPAEQQLGQDPGEERKREEHPQENPSQGARIWIHARGRRRWPGGR